MLTLLDKRTNLYLVDIEEIDGTVVAKWSKTLLFKGITNYRRTCYCANALNLAIHQGVDIQVAVNRIRMSGFPIVHATEDIKVSDDLTMHAYEHILFFGDQFISFVWDTREITNRGSAETLANFIIANASKFEFARDNNEPLVNFDSDILTEPSIYATSVTNAITNSVVTNSAILKMH
jgi:hypothetical protein